MLERQPFNYQLNSRTIRLNERDLYREIRDEGPDRLTDLQLKLQKVEEAIWMIDKKYPDRIEKEWEKWHILKKKIKSLSDNSIE